MLRKKLISAVVSVYNEECTVKDVILSLLKCEIIDEVIVVDDGSTDNTPLVIKDLSAHPKMRYIRFDSNYGKSYAMVTGVENAGGDIIVFVDADLIGLECKHIESLVSPLVLNQADMTIGRRDSENKHRVDITGPIDVWLGGERACYKEDILPILDKVRETKYGIETYLNLYYKSKNKKIKIILLEGLIHLKKYEKYRFDKAALNYTKASFQIAKTIVNNHFLAMIAAKNIIKDTPLFRLGK